MSNSKAQEAFAITAQRNIVALEGLILQAAQQGHMQCIFRTHPTLVTKVHNWLDDNGFMRSPSDIIDDDGSVLVEISWHNAGP